MTFLYPMRPGLTIPDTDAGREMLPKDWLYQVKLDDERAVIDPMGNLWTRFGKPFDAAKARKFEPAIEELGDALPDLVLKSANWFDVALIGYRKTRAAFQVVLLDIPTAIGSYADRKLLWRDLPFFRDDGDFLACQLFSFPDPKLAIGAARNMGDQCEGIIGRNPNAPYQSGDSDNMLKMRFKR